MIRIKLKAVLAEKGIKQKDLVEMTGIRQPTLSGMNNNSVKHIPLDVLDKLCTVLDCQPADLLEFVPDENEKARTLDASGQERLFLARLVHGLRDAPHLFDPTLRVGFSHDEVIQFAVKGLANEVEIIQADALCKIVVQLIDGLGANPCCTCKFALCHPPFAEAGRQQNSNHSLLSPFTEILADMYPACLHFGRKLHISGVFSDFR